MGEWEAVEFTWALLPGSYRVSRYAAGEWDAVYRPRGSHPSVMVDSADALGDPLDWPTLVEAQFACRLHAAHMALGETAEQAAATVRAVAMELAREAQEAPQTREQADRNDPARG